MENKYIPGVCNIGKAEISKRKRLGYLMLIITLALILIDSFFVQNQFINLMVFVFATSASISLIQAYMKFCAYFGIFGIFNFGNEKDSLNVLEKEYRIKDIKMSAIILSVSIIIGALAYLFSLYF